METFEVRDMRHKEKFFVDDAYLNGYAKYLGTTNSMIYFILCRHADKNQECFPSYEFIADRLGVSEATIKRGVKELREWNIISIGKRKRKSGQFLHNSYVLLDKSVWKSKPEVTSDLRQPEVMDAPDQGSPMHFTIGHPRPDKDTHIKDTHIEGSKSPLQINKGFFSRGEEYCNWLSYLEGVAKKDGLLAETEKFITYWTEPNSTGTKLRWQMQETFDVKRRLLTWLNRAKLDYKQQSASKYKAEAI